ncbi:hypothetical protein EDC94DRAFT_516037, partial [Helicostylum pulchrum]
YKTKFKDCVIKLNEYLREVVIKAQLFVSYCLVDQKEYYYHKCIYKQSFWYSVCQLIMKIPVTNKANISSSFVMDFSEFNEMYPTIFCPLKERKITGYSDSLTYACVILATTYINLMVETFEHTINIYLKRNLQKIFPSVSAFSIVSIFEDGN